MHGSTSMASTKCRRGVSALLSDITNNSSDTDGDNRPNKRACTVTTGAKIKEQINPRGMHATHSDESDKPKTLYELVHKRSNVLDEGKTCLSNFIERNTTFANKKALALHVFALGVLSERGIKNSCALAAAITGFRELVIRQWASDIFKDYFATLSCLDDITDEDLEEELSSNRGKHANLSLLNDEGFQLAAREYVRERGYSKGEPNLTLHQFISWVKENYGVEMFGNSQ